MSITSTGDGLSIVIKCEYTSRDNWMTFASWYSINKNLPDAAVKIISKRAAPVRVIYDWATKLGVDFLVVSEFKEYPESLIITPDVMAVRQYNKDCIGPVDVKSGVDATFVSYLNGCGKFVPSSWIDSMRPPFGEVSNYWTGEITVNEMKVLKLWERIGLIHTNL